ncbi:MAG: NUDIX domain-containing protein [Geminicoccaceae bacterium]
MSFLARAKVLLASLIFRQKVINRWAHKSLPTKRLAACVMLFDDDDRLLVLETTYSKGWLVPGGTVERNESPWEGARRETREEIGLELDRLEFAAVDWRSSDDEYDDSLHFVFDGGTLSAEQKARIRADGIEIAGYRFADRAEAEKLLEPHLCKRIMAYWDRHADVTRPLVLNRGALDRQSA